MRSVSKASLELHLKQLLESVDKRCQALSTYLHMGMLQADLNLLEQTLSGKLMYDYEKVQSAISRVKDALFSPLMPLSEVLVPDSFYQTPVGLMLRQLEAGYQQEEKYRTVAEIAADLGWSRTWVFKHVYDQEDAALSAADIQGKMPGCRSGRGYVIPDSVFLEWKKKHYKPRARGNQL